MKTKSVTTCGILPQETRWWIRLLLVCGFLAAALVRPAPAAAVDAVSLAFDPAKFQASTLTAGGQTLAYRAYEGVVYVANPVDARYQSMNIYVPSAWIMESTTGGRGCPNAVSKVKMSRCQDRGQAQTRYVHLLVVHGTVGPVA
jgi:hypothetical protein